MPPLPRNRGGRRAAGARPPKMQSAEELFEQARCIYACLSLAACLLVRVSVLPAHHVTWALAVGLRRVGEQQNTARERGGQ